MLQQQRKDNDERRKRRLECRRRRKSWRKNSKEVWEVANNGSSPDCYEYVYFRQCRCLEEVRGPYKVRVQQGKIVQLVPQFPDDGNNIENDGKDVPSSVAIPTMDDLLKRVRRDCLRGCRLESGGAADACDVTYGPYGDVKSLLIDYNFGVADEEYWVEISDFKLC